MTDRQAAQQRNLIGLRDFDALPTPRRPILDQPTQARKIERVGGWLKRLEAIDLSG
jgi:hypothetical protein